MDTRRHADDNDQDCFANIPGALANAHLVARSGACRLTVVDIDEAPHGIRCKQLRRAVA
jgi:hypothetical protein